MCDNFLATLIQLPLRLYQFLNWLLDSNGNFTIAAQNQVIYPGDLIFSAAPLSPDANRLLCDGSEVPQSQYPNLYAAIGLTYGTPALGTNFILPDFRARFPVGVGVFPSGASAGLGTEGGEEMHVLSEGEMPPHLHNLVTPYISNNTGSPGTGLASGSGTDVHNQLNTYKTDSAGGVGLGSALEAAPHNCLPPYVPAYIYIHT